MRDLITTVKAYRGDFCLAATPLDPPREQGPQSVKRGETHEEHNGRDSDLAHCNGHFHVRGGTCAPNQQQKKKDRSLTRLGRKKYKRCQRLEKTRRVAKTRSAPLLLLLPGAVFQGRVYFSSWRPRRGSRVKSHGGGSTMSVTITCDVQ